MSAHRPLPPQIEQFIHDNPQGILTSFLRNEMRQLRIRAEMVHSGNVDPETRRLASRHIYSATTRSADWENYDRITAGDKRVALIVRPDPVYGSALAKIRDGAAR